MIRERGSVFSFVELGDWVSLLKSFILTESGVFVSLKALFTVFIGLGEANVGNSTLWTDFAYLFCFQGLCGEGEEVLLLLRID